MTILEKKNLEILFAWAQFYQNSEHLAVARYPRYYYYENDKRGLRTTLTAVKQQGMVMYVPDGDQSRYNKCQEQINKIGNK